MMNYTFLILSFIATGSFGCATINAPANESNSSEYSLNVKRTLDEILKKCASNLSEKDPIYGQDTISFEIGPDGSAKKGIAYRSRNTISKSWANCLEENVKETNFSAPPEKKNFWFHANVNWDAVILVAPQLLTPKVKLKQAFRNDNSFLQKCFLNYTEKGGQEQGGVKLQFEVTPNGEAKNIRTFSNEIKDKNLLSCIESAVAKIRFPKTTDTSLRVVAFPLVFERQLVDGEKTVPR